MWAITDLVTARALGLTPVAIENAKGDFVAPTPESMTAAVATMKTNADGLLLPDPLATSEGVHTSGGASAAEVVEPYPLTFVQYAMSPAQPLVDPLSSARRTDSQALLSSWLGYLTGQGQHVLPSGFEPLPPALQSVAQTTIPLVGSAPVTGPCAATGTSEPAPSRTGGARRQRRGVGTHRDVHDPAARHRPSAERSRDLDAECLRVGHDRVCIGIRVRRDQGAGCRGAGVRRAHAP